MQASAIKPVVARIQPDEGHAHAVEIVDQRVLEEAHHQHAQHAAHDAADCGRQHGLGQQHADDLAAARADRLQQAELAPAFGDDRREQHADHERGADEHEDHQGEDAVEQRRQALADGRQRRFAGHHLDVGKSRQDGEAHLLRRGARRQLDQDAGQLVGLERRFVPQIWRMMSRSSSSVANVMNRPRSWVPTAVLPSRP